MITHRKSLPARLTAALLALVMVLALAPTALAAPVVRCAQCGSIDGPSTEIRAATCTTQGRYEYTCPNASCKLYNVPQSVSVGYDPDVHAAAVYEDNGDGTHSGVCTEHLSHSGDVSIGPEKHTPGANGVCTKCGAVDYSDITLNLPKSLTVPVALGSAGAKLSAGEVKVLLGERNDVTNDYNLSYTWYYQGSPVASTEEYVLPETVTSKEGTYYYTLFVSATPKNSLRQPVPSSCNVTVQVKELITATAAVSSDETSFYLGDPDTWSGESVSAQIYAQVQDLCARDADPDYVVFHTLPNSSVGSLNVSTLSTLYYFEDYTGKRALDDVKFTVASGAGAVTGDYTVGFTVYDTDRKSYEGVLAITVQQYTGNMDVVLAASAGAPVSLSASDFEDFWTQVYGSGVLDSISFEETPRSTEGSLYVDYISASAPGLRVTAKDTFFVAPGKNQYSIDAVTFVPGVKQSEYITLDFEARGTKNNGRVGYLSGTLYIFIHTGGSADVTVTAASGGTALSPEDFQKAYQSATGGTGSSFYIQLLEVPARGELYVGRTATRQGTLLTQRAVSGYTFSYSDSRGESISTLTYLPAAGTSPESVRYVACSAQGKPLYTGRIIFTAAATNPSTPGTATGLVLNLTGGAAGVKLSAAEFENLPGAAAPKLTMVSFTPPAVTYGVLYYGRTDTSAGTRITSSNSYFSAATSNPPLNSLSLDNLTFVPAAGVTGVVPIPFTATDAANNRHTGTLRITITATGTSNPGTNPPGTTNPGTTTPGTPVQAPKTFSDVPKTAGSYPYITELTTSGAISGYEDGTFRPGNPVTLGEALKLIMWVVNPAEYSSLPPVSASDHWASGYLARASQDGLLPSGVNRDLDRPADRYTIAEIAAKSMKLTPVETAAASPFADMQLTHAAAKYVLALYNARIVTGSVNKSGQTVFYGVNAITREEFATIVWRMQSYLQNGAVGVPSIS